MNFLFAPACYLLIFSLALGGGAMGRVLASRPAGFLGDISYSTYLSHPWVDYVLQRMRLDFSSTVPHLVLSVVVIYIMSWVLYTVIEVPAKRWLRWSMNTIRRPARFSYRL
jgi:peptidoglycan/LPS O-acetylase OafA/YrhL